MMPNKWTLIYDNGDFWCSLCNLEIIDWVRKNVLIEESLKVVNADYDCNNWVLCPRCGRKPRGTGRNHTRVVA